MLRLMLSCVSEIELSLAAVWRNSELHCRAQFNACPVAGMRADGCAGSYAREWQCKGLAFDGFDT